MSEVIIRCRTCTKRIGEEREMVGLCADCTWKDIVASRQAPLAETFDPFVCENLFNQPVEVKSRNHFKELQKLANVTHIGDDGLKDTVMRVKDRESANAAAKLKFRRSVMSHRGRLPDGFGKKKPYDPRLDREPENRRKHDSHPVV